MTAMSSEQGVSKIIADMSPEERDRTLRDLLHQQQTAQGDDTRKIEDANLLLRLRPKVLVTTYIPLTKRYAQRLQDRKVWDKGIIDPLADEDIPGRPQIIRVETQPDGEVLFSRDEVLGMPGTSQPVHVQVPPPDQRRMVPPAPVGVEAGDEADEEVEAAGPVTVPVDPQVLSDMLARLESLEEENARLRAGQPPEPEPLSAPAKAADRRRRKAEVESDANVSRETSPQDETKEPETVGADAH